MYTGNEGDTPIEAGTEVPSAEVLSAETIEPTTDGGLDDGTEIEDIEQIKGESARETARRVFEQGTKAVEDQGSEGEKGQRVRGPDGKFVKADKPQTQPQQQAELAAPSAWTAAEKEAFNKADPVVKAAVERRERELQSHATRKYEEASRLAQESQHIVQAVRPYLMENPAVMEAGYTEASFVAGLVGAHKALQNPSTKWQKWLDIGAEVGVDAETIQELRDIIMGEGGQMSGRSNDITSHPEYVALQNEIAPLKSWYQQQTEAQRKAAVDDFANRVRSVMNEQDSSGAYIYPRAHDAEFINQVRPLMSALMANEPSITPEEAFRRTYVAMYGLPHQQNHIRPTQNNFQQNNFNPRAATAAVSVRGKTASNTVTDPLDSIPRGLSAKETARLAFSQSRR